MIILLAYEKNNKDQASDNDSGFPGTSSISVFIAACSLLNRSIGPKGSRTSSSFQGKPQRSRA